MNIYTNVIIWKHVPPIFAENLKEMNSKWILMTMAVAGSTVWMAQPVWGQELAKERADLYFQEGKLNFETKNKAFRMKNGLPNSTWISPTMKWR